MGLVLSAIVVCVGIAEVLDCWHHFLLHIVQPQYNPLPFRLDSKRDVRNERDLSALSESRRTSNIDICWPKDISPNDDLHVIRKRTHSESDRTYELEQSALDQTIRIHDVGSETLTCPNINNVNRSSPRITIHDLEPNDQLRVVSPLMRTELSPDHLSLDVIVESDSSSELDEPSQIENIAYKKKIEESLKTILKAEDSAEETGELSRITEQNLNETLSNQPPRPCCPSSLSKEDVIATNDDSHGPAPLLMFTENILASSVQQVPCRYSDSASTTVKTASSLCGDQDTKENIIEFARTPVTSLTEEGTRENNKSTPENIQSVESILDEGLDPIPEFPEIRLHESSPVPDPDCSDSSVDTSDASWIAKGKTSDRPLIIRLPEFKDLNSESKKSHKAFKKDKSDNDIFYDAEDSHPLYVAIPNTSNEVNLEQPAVSFLRFAADECVKKEQNYFIPEISSLVEHDNKDDVEKEVVSFGDCVPNTDRLHNLQRDTNSSSSSLSGIPQLPEDVKDYSTETPLPTNNGFGIDHDDVSDYESTHIIDYHSSLEQRIIVEEIVSPIREENRNIVIEKRSLNVDVSTDLSSKSSAEQDVSFVTKHSTDDSVDDGNFAAKKICMVPTTGSHDEVVEIKTTTPLLPTKSVENLVDDPSQSNVSDNNAVSPIKVHKNELLSASDPKKESCSKEEISPDDSNNRRKSSKCPPESLLEVNPQNVSKTVEPSKKGENLQSSSSKNMNVTDTADATKRSDSTKPKESSATSPQKKHNSADTSKPLNVDKPIRNSSKGSISTEPLQPGEECVQGLPKTSEKDKASNTKDESKHTKHSVQSEIVHPRPSTSGLTTSRAKEDDPESKASWLIFSGEYTKAMDKDWHTGHFCCWQCDESLTGQRYVLRDEHPYCIKCYETVFANGCEECNKTIGIDSKDLSYKDKHWHEACFLCNKCRVSLVDKQFGSKLDKIFCGNCYDAQFASRCDGCGQIFKAGTKKMEYKTRQWHEPCFACCVCKSPIGTKSFIPREQEIYCATCYEEKFATRCVKCNKIITSGGVTYKNEPWHRECFTCTNCNSSLAGQRFTSRDEKPYCAECFGELFAKRCTSCSKPITGIGGTRFISFEDRHWHNDCFICASCKTSLVGRGFITDADDIICPECAKQKLM